MTTRLLTSIVLSVIFVVHACAQGPIRGPMVGWVWDSHQESIRPILGITGSSILGKGTDLGFAVKSAAISGRQEYALVLGGDDRLPYMVDLRPLTPTALKLDGVSAGATALTLSPRGLSAALWYADAKKISVVTGLGANPVFSRDIDLTVEGAPAAVAISDDGGAVLASYPDSQTLLAVDGDGNRMKLPIDAVVRAMAFLEDSRDALFTAADGLYIARAIPAVSEIAQLRSSDALIAVTPLDAQRVLIIDSGSQSVVELNVATGATRSVDCPCVPTGLTRMTNSGTFRLNEVSSDPIWLVDVSDNGLRTVFVPPDPPNALPEE